MTKRDFITEFVLNMSKHNENHYDARHWVANAARAWDALEELAPVPVTVPPLPVNRNSSGWGRDGITPQKFG